MEKSNLYHFEDKDLDTVLSYFAENTVSIYYNIPLEMSKESKMRLCEVLEGNKLIQTLSHDFGIDKGYESFCGVYEITPEGVKFLSSGGFTNLSKLQKKKTRFWRKENIQFIGAIIGIISALIGIIMKFTQVSDLEL